ncbi:MAG TPA: GGDEF domain-containing protein, partial [Thermoleophilaceae bacterium]|nr:GGDEF domain-containing protein [Thermoleophilaceae bacterium]
LPVELVFELMEKGPGLKLVPVTSGHRAAGLISRMQLVDRFARPYRRELLAKRRCTAIMDEAAVIVDVGMPLRDLARVVASAGSETSGEGFVVTDAGRYLGVCETKSLMLEITEMEMQAARYANPLTLLPGNVPIDEHISDWLAQGETFRVCYADLDYFKPFNDRYGYLAGDEAIRLTAELLLRHADPACDFVGHVGGDDFVVLFRSPDWLERCRGVESEFEQTVSRLIAPEDLARGVLVGHDRQGRPLAFPLLSVSLAVIGVHDDRFGTREIAAAAAAAKEEAKRMAGTCLFLERRGPFAAER